MTNRLNPAHLQTFAVVAETGNLSRASLRLDLGQSAISAQMKQLQLAMGEPLYRRSGHGVTLTAAGEALLPYAQEVSRQVALAEGSRWQHHSRLPRSVRLGLCLTLGETLPPLILQACAKRCPELHVDVTVATTPELAQAVERGELWMAFAGGNAQANTDSLSSLKVQHIATDHLVWVPPGQTDGGWVTLRESAQVPWLWAHAHSTVKSTVENAAQRLGIECPVSHVLGSYSAVRHGILSGLGGAFLPHHHLKVQRAGDELAGYELVDTELRLAYQALTSLHSGEEWGHRVLQVALGVLDETLDRTTEG